MSTMVCLSLLPCLRVRWWTRSFRHFLQLNSWSEEWTSVNREIKSTINVVTDSMSCSEQTTYAHLSWHILRPVASTALPWWRAHLHSGGTNQQARPPLKQRKRTTLTPRNIWKQTLCAMLYQWITQTTPGISAKQILSFHIMLWCSEGHWVPQGHRH